MHDFYLMIPYGLVLIGGGVFGYFRKGITSSLAGGAGIGLLITLAGYISLKAFEGKKNSYPAFILETGVQQLDEALVFGAAAAQEFSEVQKMESLTRKKEFLERERRER
ncbi:hypothetical protein COP2_034091 [Malus domestica]